MADSASVNFGDQGNQSGSNIQNSGDHALISTTTYNYFGAQDKDKRRTDLESDCRLVKRQKVVELEELKSSLKEYSKTLLIPTVAWVEENEPFVFDKFYVDLEEEVTVKQKTTQPMKLEEMFEPIEEKKPKRILIESKPGYGKTTLSLKIIHDWANEKPYMQQFELVFRIALRDLKGKTLQGELDNFVEFFTGTNLIKFDKTIQEKSLLILDGYDELGNESREDVTRVLHGLKFNHMTVIVTCRCGLFSLKKKDLRELLPKQLGNVNPQFHDKKVTILGVGEDQRLEFIKKFCPNRPAEEVVANIAKWPNKIMEMLRSPLLLFLVSYFNGIKLKFSEKSSITDLYMSLINNIVRTNLRKDGSEVDETFDLFDFSDKQSEICHSQKVLEKFGKECFDNLMEGRYKFKISDLTNEVYSIGLLIRYKGSEGLYLQDPYYDCFHLSIIEFSAAYFLLFLRVQNDVAMKSSM